MNPVFLDDKERSYIIAFTSNKPMLDAVKKVLMHTITHQGVFEPGKTPESTNWVFGLVSPLANDEQLGQLVRASAAGLGYLSKGFETLEAVSMPEKKEKTKNPAV